MSLPMTKQYQQASHKPYELDAEWTAALSRADSLAERIAANPEALAALRCLIAEGLEGPFEEADDDELWLASLADGIRSRAAARR